MQMLLEIVFVVIGFVMLVKGADYFVDGAASLAKKMGIPEIVVGLTVVAFGTSAPEAAVSISSAMQNASDLAVGNVLGSNIFNILVILGLTSIICELKVKRGTVLLDIPFMIGVTILLLILGSLAKTLGFSAGILFLAILFTYVVYLIIYSIKTNVESDEEIKNLSGLKIFLYIVCGMGVIILGSNLTVAGARGIAETMGVSEKIIGLTIVAFGTSLPELVTSVAAARKHSADIAIGNIVGSNLFNILFVLGMTCVIKPTPFISDVTDFTMDGVIALASGLLLLLALLPKKRLHRPVGIVMILSYVVYLGYMIIG